MTNKKQKILNRKDGYYVNIDKNIYKSLSRRQVAFVCLIDKLNKANLIATNKELGAYCGYGEKYISTLVKEINKKVPGLLIVNQNTKVNHNGKILKEDTELYLIARSIKLSRELHTKGEEYINLPNFSVSKRSQFLSGNELTVLSYIKAMPERSFKGFLRLISKKLGLSLGIINRALEKLSNVKAIFRRSSHVLQKLKNIYYTVNKIDLNQNWRYEKQDIDDPRDINKKIRKKYQYEESMDKIWASIGGL